MSNLIASVIRQARLQKGLSGAAVAKEVGLSQASISRFELGDRDLKLGDVQAIAAVVGVEITAQPLAHEPLSEVDRELVEAFVRVLRKSDDDARELYALEFAARERQLQRKPRPE
jgi:transcriptional regulator with XRE-family HTH domain